MPGLEKDIISSRHKTTLSHWEVLEYSIRRTNVNRQHCFIQFGGFHEEQNYLEGGSPIDTRSIIVPYADPDGGDRFSSLRSAIQSAIDADLANALKLAKKIQEFEGAVEK